MQTISRRRRLIILGVVIGLLVGLSIFIVVSAIVHHLGVAAGLALLGMIAIGLSWLLGRRPFFIAFFGGIGLFLIGLMLLLFAGLYIESMAAIVVTFVGGVLLSVLSIGRPLLDAHKLSPVEQQREAQRLIRSLLDKHP